MHEIRSDITGVVWKLEVAVGDTVSEGTEIAILESMKMEIPIESSRAGVIEELHVAEGDAVLEGALIATVR